MILELGRQRVLTDQKPQLLRALLLAVASLNHEVRTTSEPDGSKYLLYLTGVGRCTAIVELHDDAPVSRATTFSVCPRPHSAKKEAAFLSSSRNLRRQDVGCARQSTSSAAMWMCFALVTRWAGQANRIPTPAGQMQQRHPKHPVNPSCDKHTQDALIEDCATIFAL